MYFIKFCLKDVIFYEMNILIRYNPKSIVMKRIFLIVGFTLFMVGCNVNPNKEERIQKLEKEIKLSTEKVKELEIRIKTLEELRERLKQD